MQPQTFFPTQPITAFGNSTGSTRNSGVFRQFSENPSLSRTFNFKEKAHLEASWRGVQRAEPRSVRPH